MTLSDIAGQLEIFRCMESLATSGNHSVPISMSEEPSVFHTGAHYIQVSCQVRKLVPPHFQRIVVIYGNIRFNPFSF